MNEPADPAGDFIDACIGDLDAARRMVAEDPQVLYLTKIGSPILHWMVIEDFQVGTQRLLEEFKVDVEHRDEGGKTALHQAAFIGRFGGARILLKHGADPNAIDETFNDNALHKAVQGEHIDVISLLLGHGAKPDYALDSITTIFHAMAGWTPDSRELLLQMLKQMGLTPKSFLKTLGKHDLYESPEEAFGWLNEPE